MIPCAKECDEKKVSCDREKCKFWINYEEDFNCCLISIEKNGSMSLRDVGERLHLTPVRIKQIQDNALKNLKKKNFDLK